MTVKETFFTLLNHRGNTSIPHPAPPQEKRQLCGFWWFLLLAWKTFSPPLRVSDPDMHHGSCVTHVSWCMPGSLTTGFLWSRWRGKCCRHSWRMRNPQFYVSGKRPMWDDTHDNDRTYCELVNACSPNFSPSILLTRGGQLLSHCRWWGQQTVLNRRRTGPTMATHWRGNIPGPWLCLRKVHSLVLRRYHSGRRQVVDKRPPLEEHWRASVLQL